MDRKQIVITQENKDSIVSDWHNLDSIDEGIKILQRVIKQAKKDKKRFQRIRK